MYRYISTQRLRHTPPHIYRYIHTDRLTDSGTLRAYATKHDRINLWYHTHTHTHTHTNPEEQEKDRHTDTYTDTDTGETVKHRQTNDQMRDKKISIDAQMQIQSDTEMQRHGDTLGTKAT